MDGPTCCFVLLRGDMQSSFCVCAFHSFGFESPKPLGQDDFSFSSGRSWFCTTHIFDVHLIWSVMTAGILSQQGQQWQRTAQHSALNLCAFAQYFFETSKIFQRVQKREQSLPPVPEPRHCWVGSVDNWCRRGWDGGALKTEFETSIQPGRSWRRQRSRWQLHCWLCISKWRQWVLIAQLKPRPARGHRALLSSSQWSPSASGRIVLRCHVMVWSAVSWVTKRMVTSHTLRHRKEERSPTHGQWRTDWKGTTTTDTSKKKVSYTVKHSGTCRNICQPPLQFARSARRCHLR